MLYCVYTILSLSLSLPPLTCMYASVWCTVKVKFKPQPSIVSQLFALCSNNSTHTQCAYIVCSEITQSVATLVVSF